MTTIDEPRRIPRDRQHRISSTHESGVVGGSRGLVGVSEPEPFAGAARPLPARGSQHHRGARHRQTGAHGAEQHQGVPIASKLKPTGMFFVMMRPR